MDTSKKTSRLLLGAVALGAVVATATPAAASPSHSSGGTAQSGYNAIPSKLPANVSSVGFEATGTNEFGDEVGLDGTERTLQSMSVVLSSWGCESGHWNTGDCTTTPGATFDVPLTFTVYADNAGVPGSVLAQQTQTVAVAYRPSASAQCSGDDAGKWYSTRDRTCYNGYAQTVSMTLPARTLTDTVFWTVAFDTTHSGYVPFGESTDCYTSAGGCGYDSLNVGAWSAPHAPYAGTDVDEDQAFRDGAVETGWTGYRPLAAIATS
jgi:hypothetical protein